MAEREYERLTRSRMRRTGVFAAFATRSSLWLGKDHVLMVDSSGYMEQYKRFYFRDIQAVTVRRTKRQQILHWLLVVLLALCGLVLVLGIREFWRPPLAPGDVWGFLAFGTPFAVALGLMFLNHFRGPGCLCHLHTAVQVELLPSLNRVRRAHRVLERLRPLIETAQGPMTREEFALNLANQSSAGAPPVIARYSAPEPPALIRPYQGKSHLILFWMLLADLPLTTMHFAIQSGWFDALSWLMLLATVGFAIAALMQQRNTDLPDGLRIIPKATLVFTAISFITALGYGIYVAITNPGFASRKLSFWDDPVVLVMSCITTSISVILGTLGLVRLRKFRAASATPIVQAANTPSQNVL